MGCKVILVYDEYLKAIERQEQKYNEIEEMKKQMEIIIAGHKELLSLLKDPEKLIRILRKD